MLRPRGLDYKVQFPGPTGANTVESALKLARKITGRESIINFTNAFHGMTLGALSVTGNSMKRGGAGIPLVHATPMPYDNYFDGTVPDFMWLDKLLQDSGSGLNEPAAVIVETVQGEGGINPARIEWLQGLAELCKRHDILLICDDVQMGVGRTGPFFSFEIAGIQPDIVCLSKSISGYGLPMALTLIKPEYDQWGPGEHNGTFRGNNPAFVTATAALNTFWRDDELERSTLAKGERVHEALDRAGRGVADRRADPEGPRPGPRAALRAAGTGGEGVCRRVRTGAPHGDRRPVRRGDEDAAGADDHRRRARRGTRDRDGVRPHRDTDLSHPVLTGSGGRPVRVSVG